MCSCAYLSLLFGAHAEEFRKNQRKSHMKANLKYFTETSCKATESDTIKVKEKTDQSESVFCTSFIFQLLKTTHPFLYRVSNMYSLFSMSNRSSTTIQGDSPGINWTDLPRKPRRPRSQSLCSQRRSSSSSKKNISAGPLRRRNKAH